MPSCCPVASSTANPFGISTIRHGAGKRLPMDPPAYPRLLKRARPGCNSPFKVGSRLRQNAQYAATSASPVYAFIGSPHVSSPSANHHNKYRLENDCTDDYTSVENAKVRRQTKVRRFFNAW